MDKRFIKALLEEGKMIKDIPKEEALVKLNNDIMTVYVMNGLHRGMTPEAFKEEVRTCAVALYQEMTTDPLYKTIRDKEISYIFSNGMKGRLNADKDIVLSYKNLIRWVEGYVKHPDRREALSMYYDEHRSVKKQLPPHVTTDEDYRRMVNDAWKDWCKFKESEDLKKKIIQSSKMSKSVADILGTPLSCLDYGKVKIRYLKRIGIAKGNESLTDVFNRALSSGFDSMDITRFNRNNHHDGDTVNS